MTMKKVIVLALSASIASCLTLDVINQSNYLSAKAHIASYLVKQLHMPHDDVRGVLSYMTPKQNNMYDITF